jgi:hypothetical protein
MDGYISKPITREELEAALVEHGGKAGKCLPAREAAPPAAPAPAAAGWDVRKFLEKLGGDENLLREITDIFLDETPNSLSGCSKRSRQGTPS